MQLGRLLLRSDVKILLLVGGLVEVIHQLFGGFRRDAIRRRLRSVRGRLHRQDDEQVLPVLDSFDNNGNWL